MKILDYGLSFLFILLSAGHGFIGTPQIYGWGAPEAVWSFSGSLAAWLIAILNILRIGRPGDRPLAAVALVAALGWAGLMFWLASVADMMGDVRIWLFVATASALALMNARAFLRARA